MNNDFGKPKRPAKPYQALGAQIKAARISMQKTVIETAGAVEVDESVFKKIELGEQRPAEDTLAVIISYLGIKEDQADNLWDLAGYEDDKSAGNVFDLGQQIAMVMPMDARVIYTDMVHVVINDFGVMMNFMQSSGPGSQPLAVSRIGMSKEHAKSVLQILDKSLKQAEIEANKIQKPKQLPAPIATEVAKRRTVRAKPEAVEVESKIVESKPKSTGSKVNSTKPAPASKSKKTDSKTSKSSDKSPKDSI